MRSDDTPPRPLHQPAPPWAVQRSRVQHCDVEPHGLCMCTTPGPISSIGECARCHRLHLSGVQPHTLALFPHLQHRDTVLQQPQVDDLPQGGPS